jgi:hypothetical protein
MLVVVARLPIKQLYVRSRALWWLLLVALGWANGAAVFCTGGRGVVTGDWWMP